MKKIIISVIGQGYVGLALSTALGKYFPTIGFDSNKQRIDELNHFIDINKQLTKKKLKLSNVLFSSNISEVKNSNIFIFCLPTPINKRNKPDISILKKTTIKIAKILKKNDIVIYESTVYPGLTEEICIPLIEKYSRLKIDIDIGIGYSPERINPGDRFKNISNIKKIISARNNKTLVVMNLIYSKIVKAGIFKADNIKTAEAAKVIENAQRDINIAFINELSIIFDRMNISTSSVLKAASTKWNFLNFKPGLVGGHCIGVDPYYLTYKSNKIGYNPKMILAGRNINESMDQFIIDKIYKYKREKKLKKIVCTVFGVTFKENCPDYRNSKSITIINKLKSDKDINLQVHDPIVNQKEFEKENNINLIKFSQLMKSDIAVISVKHDKYKNISVKKWHSILKNSAFVVDIKSLIDIKKIRNYKNIVLSQL